MNWNRPESSGMGVEENDGRPTLSWNDRLSDALTKRNMFRNDRKHIIVINDVLFIYYVVYTIYEPDRRKIDLL